MIHFPFIEQSLNKQDILKVIRDLPRRFYVYALVDPRDFSIRYIGKGTGDRCVHHLKRNSNVKKIQWINDLLSFGLEPIYFIFKCFDIEKEAYEFEDNLILHFKRIQEGGKLTNIVTSSLHPPIHYSITEIKDRLKNLHPYFSYPYIDKEYVNIKEPITVKCSKCKSSYNKSVDEILRNGCNTCSRVKVGKSLRSNTSEFIRKAKSIHGINYSYNKVIYKTAIKKISIYCNNCHTIFRTTPNNHLSGKNCPKCGLRPVYDLESFLKHSKKVQPPIYDYNNTIFINLTDKVNIHCNNCNLDFQQSPIEHIKGKGCNNRCNIKYKTFKDKQELLKGTGYTLIYRNNLNNKILINDITKEELLITRYDTLNKYYSYKG